MKQPGIFYFGVEKRVFDLTLQVQVVALSEVSTPGVCNGSTERSLLTLIAGELWEALARILAGRRLDTHASVLARVRETNSR
jgi:hypothetical protein